MPYNGLSDCYITISFEQQHNYKTMIPSKQYNSNKKKSLIQPYLVILGCYFLMNAKLGCRSGVRSSASNALSKTKEGFKKFGNKVANGFKSNSKRRTEVQQNLNQGENGFKYVYMDTLNTAAKMSDSNSIVKAIEKIDGNSQITKDKVAKDILLKGEHFTNVIRLGGNPMKKWLNSEKIAKNPLLSAKRNEYLLHKVSRELVAYNKYKDYVDVLDVNDFFLATDKGYTPLHILARKRDCKKLEYLVESALNRNGGVFATMCQTLSNKVPDKDRSVLGFLVLERGTFGRMKLRTGKAKEGNTNGVNGLKAILAVLSDKKSLDASAYDGVLVTLENDIDDQIRRHTTDKSGEEASGKSKVSLRQYYTSLKDIIAKAKSGDVSDFANQEIDDEEDEDEND